jgi:AcrR family transcriptional regulator
MLPQVPKLWTDTLEDHRRAVREATLDTAAALVAAHGLRGVTMSRIAEETGIGRATLYKYFPDVESILLAWHERQVHAHLEQLTALESHGDAATRLAAVLEAYALTQRAQHEAGLAATLHRGEHVARAHRHLHDFVSDLIAAGVADGQLRDDVSAGELATYCLHALGAAGDLESRAAVRRLVAVTLSGVRRAA